MGEETDIAEPMSSEDVVAAEDVTANEPSKEHRRKRKKHLYKSLQQLIEFYLGDVNISKDRFISQSIQGQPFVYMNLSSFLKFNKVKNLTSSLEDLQKALLHSEILQLSDDGLQVCRKTPIKIKENEDECTIYVEQLGPDTDHELLSKFFSEFGSIDYISMPRFSHNGKCKGFAFVEFKEPEFAKNALEAFNARGCCLSPHMAPEELMSIKNYEHNKENNKGDDKTKIYKSEECGNSSKNNQTEEVQHIHNTENLHEENDNEHETVNESAKKEKRKRKHSEENEKVNQKKNKSNQAKEILDNQIEGNKIHKDSKKERKSVDEIKNSSDSELTGELVNKKNKGKVKQKIDSDPKLDSKPSPVDENDIVEEENKLSRNKLKRKHFSSQETIDKNVGKSDEEVDEVPKKKQKSDTEGGTDTEVSEKDVDEDATVKARKKRKKKKKLKKDNSTAIALGLKILPKKEWKQLRNKYLNMQRDMMRSLKQHLSYSKWEKNKSEEKLIKQEDPVKPGTVVKIILDEPVSNVKAAKSEMRVHPEIRYIDVTEGNSCIYLRTSTPEVAVALVQAKHWPSMEIIQGTEETEYWEKMKKDRENHFNKNKHNQRGRSKLLKRAERFQGKHIATFETL